MVDTEFGYVEGGSRGEGRNRTPRQSRRWWLPSPQVPGTGLSDTAKNKLLNQGRVVHQVFKAAKTIKESVLLEMPVPTIIKDALPKVLNFFSLSLSVLSLLWMIFQNFHFPNSMANLYKNNCVLDLHKSFVHLMIVKLIQYR